MVCTRSYYSRVQSPSIQFDDFFPRNQTLHLFLHWLARYSHLEVMISGNRKGRWVSKGGWKGGNCTGNIDWAAGMPYPALCTRRLTTTVPLSHCLSGQN